MTESEWRTHMLRGPGAFIPIKTVSEANTREHWRQRAARTKQNRWAGAYWTRAKYPTLVLPATVTLTRYGPRELDNDNLGGSFKALRDGIADAFGVDDGDARYAWVYRQERSRWHGVRIEINQ